MLFFHFALCVYRQMNQIFCFISRKKKKKNQILVFFFFFFFFQGGGGTDLLNGQVWAKK